MADIFISYSRKDIAFASILHEALTEQGIDAWIDWQDIPPSADWLAEVYEAIEQSDAFVFIVSDKSVASEICNLEIRRALDNNKRLIPIVVNEIEPHVVPPEIAALNWIFFRDEDEKYQKAVTDLVTAIQVDHAWVKQHTHWQNRALAWDRNERESGFLLRSQELNDAETWLAEATGKDPAPTTLHTQYILASRTASSRRQRVTLGAVAAGLVVAVVLGILAWTQRNLAVSEGFERATAQANAESARGTAVYEAEARATEIVVRETAQAVAEEQRDLALSRSLAAQALNQKEDFLDLSLLLSLEALNLSDTVEARSSLLAGLTTNAYLERILFNNEISVECVAYSPTGNLLATGHSDDEQRGQVNLWDPDTGEKVGVVGVPGASVGRIQFSSEGRVLAVAAGTPYLLTLWDMDTLTQIPGELDPEVIFDLHPSLETVAMVSEEGVVQLVDFQTGNVLQVLSVEEEYKIRTLAFSEDGTQLAAGSLTAPILVWDLNHPELTPRVYEGTDGAYLIEFHPDGKRLAFAIEYNFQRLKATIKLLNLQTGQTGGGKDVEMSMFQTLDFNPQGTMLVVADETDEVQLWEVSNLVLWSGQILSGHSGEITDVSFHPDGHRLASISTSRTFHWKPEATTLIWNLDEIYPVLRVNEGENDLDELQFEPGSGAVLAAAGTEPWVEFWDPETAFSVGRTFKRHMRGITSMAFSPDHDMLASADADQQLIFWNFASGQPLAPPLQSPSGDLYQLVFSSNGEWLAAAAEFGSVVVWNVAQAEVVHQFTPADEGTVLALAFNRDSTVLLALEEEGVVEGWDLASGELTLQQKLPEDLIGTPIAVMDRWGERLAAVRPDGDVVLLTAGGEVQSIVKLDGIDGSVGSLAFDPAHDVLVLGGPDMALVVWDIAKEQMIGSPSELPAGIKDILYSPDGSKLAVRDGENVIRIWDIQNSGDQVGSAFEYSQTFVFSEDGSWMALADYDDNISIWDVLAGEISSFPDQGPFEDVETIAYSPARTVLAAAGSNGLIGLIDPGTEELLVEPVDSGQDCVNRLVYNPDGDLFSAGCDGTVRMWSGEDLSPMELVLQHEDSEGESVSVDHIALSPDGTLLVSMGGNTLMLWDLRSEQPQAEILHGQREEVLSSAYDDWNWVTFNPAGTVLTAARTGATLDFWDVSSREWMRQILVADYGGAEGVNSVAYSPDGRWMASGHSGFTMLWDVGIMQRVGMPLAHPRTGNVFGTTLEVFNPDSDLLAASGLGGIQFWNLDLEFWKEAACRIANRSLTMEEWEQYFGTIPYRETCP